MTYERLTKRGEDHIIRVFDINDHEVALSDLKQLDIVMIVGRLTFLEDKIESGEIVDRNDYLDHLLSARSISELTDEEIEFFVKHNAKIRKFVYEDITRLTAENQRLKEEVTEQKSVAEHEHATQLAWFRIAGYYKVELDNIRRRLETVIDLSHMSNEVKQ